MSATSLATALYRANQQLGQRLASALLENQQRWLDLGARHLDAMFMTSNPPTHAKGRPVFGYNPLWQPAWVCEGIAESTLAIQSAFADEVSEAIAEWQKTCAALLPPTEGKNTKRPDTAGDVRAA